MAKIYANLIISGDKKFEDVPPKLMDSVAVILREKGFDHLIPQEETEELNVTDESIEEGVHNGRLF